MHYAVIERQSKRRYRGWLLSFALLTIVLGISIFSKLHSHHKAVAQTNTSVTVIQAQKPAITGVQGRYLFNGTTVWARQVERDSLQKNSGYDYAHPFSQLDTFNRSAYDAWSTDFECPITTNNVPFSEQVSNLVFNCRPEFLPEATKYFNLFDLANNHTDNQGGETGLLSTRKYLDATPGVQYFGSFDPSVSKDVCEIVALPIRIQKSDKTEQKSTLPIAMCAWHYFYRTPKPDEIAVMDRYAKIMPVFAFVEMGTEYHASANETQQNIAHQIIDHHPEFLIANNPHWVQNTEIYKNKLIVYSTGNFIFDQLDTETQRSASIDTTVTVKYDKNVASWVALSPSCTSFQDTCIDQAEQKGLKKVSLNLKYAVVAGQGGAGKVTHRADAATQAAVEQRLNWAANMKKLGQQ